MTGDLLRRLFSSFLCVWMVGRLTLVLPLVLPQAPPHGPECQQTHLVSRPLQTAEFYDSSRHLVDSTLGRRPEELEPFQSWKNLSQSPSVVQVHCQKPLEHCAYLMTAKIEDPILA